MSHEIETQVRAIRRWARRYLVVYGLSLVVTCVVGSIVAAGLVDYFVRFDDVGVRVICTLLVAGVLGLGLWRFLVRRLLVPLDDVQVALRIERCFPELKDRLASAIEFLNGSADDPLAGSPALRRRVIARTASEIENHNLHRVFEPRPTLRAIMAAVAVSGLFAGLIFFDPASSRIALARLSQPWADIPWPRQNMMQIESPQTRLALNQPFEVRVVAEDGCWLPDEVQIHFLYRNGDAETRETERVEPMDGVVVASKARVTRPFAYYAEGGDGRTNRYSLDVVEPPVIESMAVTLHPPDYTRWSPLVVDERLRAVTGTQVSLQGTTDKPIRSAAVVVQANGDEPVEFPAVVGSDGHSFTLAAGAGFEIEKSGNYWFALEDDEGFPGGGEVRHDIRADSDLPPTVDIVDPNANIFVTAAASVPIRIVARDDLALTAIRLMALRSDQSDAGDFEVTSFAIEHPQTPPGEGTASGAGVAHKVETTYTWELSSLGLAPGTQLSFHAAADDGKPQTSKSQLRRLTIITPEELEDRVSQQQAVIISELNRALRIERQSRERTSDLEIQFDEAGKIAKEHIDQLQGAELHQRQVERTLTSPGEGILSQIDQLMNQLGNNQVDSPEIATRMQDLSDQIGQLGKNELPAINRELTATLKRSQSLLDKAGGDAADVDDLAKSSLAETGRHQDTVIKALEGLLGELSEWDNYRRFHGEIGRLKREQSDLAESTGKFGKETLGKNVDDLTDQQRADLAKLAGRQQELANRFDKMRERMRGMQDQLQFTNPNVSGAMADADKHAQQSAVSGSMRQASRGIEQNQLGQAQAKQSQAAQDLQEMLDILSSRREHELSRLVKKLREAEDELNALRDGHKRLVKKIRDAQKIKNEQERRRELERLRRQQQQVAQQASRLARLVRRLQADRAGRSLAGAAGRMQQAGQEGQQGDNGAAQKQSDLAQENLDAAADQLRRRRQQAEMDLAMEQMAKIKDELAALVDRQQSVIDETLRLDKLAQGQGRLTRAQMQSVRDVSRQQTFLADETSQMAETISAAAVFSLALEAASEYMRQAVALLDDRQTGDAPQLAQRNAHRRLAQLIEALKPDKGDAGQGRSSPGGQGGQPPGGNEQGGDGIPQLAQLKLLKLMQQELLRRTSELDEQATAGALSDLQMQEVVALANQQGQLSDLVTNLMQQLAGADDSPENIEKDDQGPGGAEGNDPKLPLDLEDLDGDKLDLKLDELDLDELEKSPQPASDTPSNDAPKQPTPGVRGT